MSMKEGKRHKYIYGKRSAAYTVNLPIQQFRGVVAYLTRVNTVYRLTHLYANGIYAHDERHAINWVAWIKTFIFIRSVIIKESKRGNRVSFDPYGNAMWRRPYCPSRVEVSCCTFGFDAIIRRDLRTLSLPRDSPRDNFYACVI